MNKDIVQVAFMAVGVFMLWKIHENTMATKANTRATNTQTAEIVKSRSVGWKEIIFIARACFVLFSYIIF